jgi:branched-chain amino acid transport system substrate-binding protein
LYLDQIGNRAGDVTITFATYDNSTAAAATWDSGQCQKNAVAHVRATDEIAVIGTYNSGCAKVEVPILNQDPSGPMLMVSHANTNPGLTKPWEAGEPARYYPAGRRNYARVVPTDDVGARAAAAFASRDLASRKVYVLHDGATYGTGMARQFAASAKAAGITVVGDEAWDGRASSYTALFERVKASGADTVFLGGTFDQNGRQLVRDKVAVLGDNAKVRLIAPDGFTGYPEFVAMTEAQGAYLTYPGLSTDSLRARGGAASSFLAAYRARYGSDPVSSYALYAVAAVQVVLAAVEASDGTRQGVTKAVFSGAGITVPAKTSVLGQTVTIDPKTGDANIRDITVEVVKGGRETFLKVISDA